MSLEDKTKTHVLAHNWIFGPAINYYIQSRHLDIAPEKIDDRPYQQDFIYEFKNQLKDSSMISVKEYEDIGTGIYKRN